jgi:hypothetical protein
VLDPKRPIREATELPPGHEMMRSANHFENAMGASAQMHAMADLSPSVLQRLSIIHQA